jgi:transcription initiation factor IIE alpha subunit
MKLTEQIRNESFKISKPDFNKQELEIIHCIESGLTNAWQIENATNMLITSIRRALTNLDKRNIIEPVGKFYFKPTQRKVTTYRIASKQGVLF